jgi:hypothetical protein
MKQIHSPMTNITARATAIRLLINRQIRKLSLRGDVQNILRPSEMYASGVGCWLKNGDMEQNQKKKSFTNHHVYTIE